MINTIIFDLWNTLAVKDISTSNTLKEHFKINNPDYAGTYDISCQTRKWPCKEDYARQYLKTFNIPINENNIKFVVDTLDNGTRSTKIIPGMEEILIELKAKYKTALVTNSNNFEFEGIRHLGIEKHFDAIVTSFESGVPKPDRKLFDLVASKLSVGLHECVFIDDRENFIEMAKEYGMETILFKDPKQLRQELIKIKILKNQHRGGFRAAKGARFRA